MVTARYPNLKTTVILNVSIKFNRMEQTSQPKDQSLEHPSNTKGEEPAPNHQETGVETESKEAALTRKQKENLKKKQKKKQKKAQTKDAEDEEDKDQDEPEKQEEPVKEQTDGDKEGEKSEASTEPVSDFQAELEWCIKQIRLGLASNAVSKDQRKKITVIYVNCV